MNNFFKGVIYLCGSFFFVGTFSVNSYGNFVSVFENPYKSSGSFGCGDFFFSLGFGNFFGAESFYGIISADKIGEIRKCSIAKHELKRFCFAGKHYYTLVSLGNCAAAGFSGFVA